MKPALIILILFISGSFSFKDNNIHIKITENEFQINNRSFSYSRISSKVNHLKDFIAAFGINKYKKKLDKENGFVIYTFSKIGVFLIAPIESQEEILIMKIEFRESWNPWTNRYFPTKKYFVGDIDFFGKKINPQTNFKELFNDSLLNSKIDKKYYSDPNKPGVSFIIINDAQSSYSLDFENNLDTAKISRITIQL